MPRKVPEQVRRYPVKPIATVMLLLALLASITLLTVSVYPGALQDILFYGLLGSIVWVPLAALFGIAYLIALIRSGLKFTQWPLFRLGLAAAIVVSTYGLLRYYVPRRLAFMASRAEFTAMLAQTPQPDEGIEPLDKRLGLYLVKDYAATAEGGTYFRVYEAGDGLWRNVTSYGFVHKPDRDDCPYGSEAYTLRRLGGGWYWFRASEESF